MLERLSRGAPAGGAVSGGPGAAPKSSSPIAVARYARFRQAAGVLFGLGLLSLSGTPLRLLGGKFGSKTGRSALLFGLHHDFAVEDNASFHLDVRGLDSPLHPGRSLCLDQFGGLERPFE